jgi:hypothetical protein
MTLLPSRAVSARRGRQACAIAVLSVCTGAAHAQADRVITGERIKRYADGVLSLMAYTVAPDVTTSSLSISDSGTANPDLSMTQLGGGFVISDTTRLYLEGNAAYSRYDPRFVVSDGQQESEVPVKWNSVSLTGGIGWDFPIGSKWSIRPIFNFTLGDVASDIKLGRAAIAIANDSELDFLSDGRVRVYGLGGSLMAVYKYNKPDRELDLEARYTNVRLHTYDTSHDIVRGESTAESASLWARMRTPTGMVLMQRPVRYVYELAYSHYFDSGVKSLGFDSLLSLGIGLELDSSAYTNLFTRWRAILRHVTGPNITGWSVGLAASF